MKMIWRLSAAAVLTGCMTVSGSGRTQSLPEYSVNVTDAVLKPTGNHIIARYYLLADGRANCGVGQTARIVLVFHGGGGSAANFATKMPLQGCYVVAYPSGTDKKSSGWVTKGTGLSWYAYGVEQGSYKNNDGSINAVDENQFVLAVTADVRARMALPNAAVFGVGMSKGAMLAHHIACDLNLFAAFATTAGTINDLTCTPATKAPLKHIHGLADTNVCWVYTGTSCNPWPPAKPLIEGWQGVPPVAPNVLTLVDGLVHDWPDWAAADIWQWLDAR